MANPLDSTQTSPCPSGIAGHTGRFVFHKGAWTLWRCGVCGHLWTNPIPTEEELIAFYDRGYFQGDPARHGYVDYDRDKEQVSSDFVWYLEELEVLLPQKGRLLDIGAATGFFVRMAQDRGWQASGVELSEHAASVAQSKGLDVVQGTLEQHADRFRGVNVITMWDLVEHIREPFAFFKLLRTLIAPNGVIMFATPQSDSFFARVLGRWWTLLAPPQHIHYFSVPSIRACLEDAGFELTSVSWRGKDFTIAYIIHFVMGWLGFEWRWLKRLTTWKPLTRWSIRINPRDMMIVIARPRQTH